MVVPALQIHAEVAEALRAGRGVVALESTLIAHGLPWPDNLDLAREAEAIVREVGAAPATVAVLGGVPCIGLTSAQLERVAKAEGIGKLSARDLPVAMATGADGATTVAGTAALAAAAGIRLFATGGLGGVHRGARDSWDESADLAALSRTRIAVVCAGVKSILDVGATLERLESLNVLVAGYRTKRFPGFYLADSGYSLDWAVASQAEAAALIRAQDALGAGSPLAGAREGFAGMAGAAGLVIANPIPAAEQLDPTLHERVLQAALVAAEQEGIHSKAVTPFLLDFFRQATGGESLRVNKQIIRNNARLAARIAVALAEGPATA
jgi:pseudouridine-5'-phosphate glycosidase